MRMCGRCCVVGGLFLAATCLMPALRGQSVQDLQDRIRQAKSDIAALHQQINDLNSKNADLKNRIGQIQEQLRSLQNQERSLAAKNSKLHTHDSNLRGATAAEGSGVTDSLGWKDLAPSTPPTQPAAGSKAAAAKKKKSAPRASHAQAGPI
jgi:TolA-binding protein